MTNALHDTGKLTFDGMAGDDLLAALAFIDALEPGMPVPAIPAGIAALADTVELRLRGHLLGCCP